MDIYIRRQIVRRWKQEIAGSSESLLIFSPYLTSATAETVLKAAPDCSRCEVHTVFTPEVFITGASKIVTLRKLSQAKVQLFAINSLHAKLVIVPSRFASVGSQNLTNGGTQRLESTVATTDVRQVNEILNQAKEWCRKRMAITSEMIDDMEKQIRPLIKHFRRIQNAALLAAEEVARNEKAREDAREQARRAEEEAKREQERQRREAELRRKAEQDAAEQKQQHSEAQSRRYRELRSRTDQLWNSQPVRSRNIIYATVVKLPTGRKGHCGLVPQDGGILTSWTATTGQHIDFPRVRWSPCMIAGMWRLAFVRIAMRTITFVRDGLSRSNVTVAGRQWNVSIHTHAIYSDSKESAEADKPNLHYKLEGMYGQRVDIPAWFHLDGIELDTPTVTQGWFNDPNLDAWFVTNKSAIATELLRSFSESFNYSSGQYSSPDASTFFGPQGTRYMLQAAQIADRPILVATRLVY